MCKCSVMSHVFRESWACQTFSNVRVARLVFFMPTFSDLAYFELAIKISCWHFRLKCQQVIFFLLPTTLRYAKFEKVGIKNANLATLKGLASLSLA